MYMLSGYQVVLDFESKMQIAFAHGSFNVANTIIQFPLIGAWAYVSYEIYSWRRC